MTGDKLRRAKSSAARCLPTDADAKRIADYIDGYMAGGAAQVRASNKRLNPFISKAMEELEIVEREIGVPSEALKLLFNSR